MTLNSDQQQAVAAIFQFLMSPQKEFNISGPAGTGKTFLMQYIMKNVLQEYENACKILGITPVQYEVALTATTNKATEVLATSTGFPAQTIHSFMNLKVQDDYKTGETKCVPTNQFVVHSRKLIFIDEASMIDSRLYDYIHKGTDNTCKIIYLGDHCQMAPVFEKISKVYTSPKFFAELKQPMRNAGQPELVKLCNRLRQTVEMLDFFPIPHIPGVVEYLNPNQAFAFINTTFADGDNDSRILCFTNNRVQEYNQYIRNLRGYPEQFSKGEHVINNEAIMVGPKMLRVEEEFIVDSVAGSVEQFFADENDPNSVIDFYNVELKSMSGYKVTVKVPLNMDHFQTLKKYYARYKDWSKFYKLKNNFPDLRAKDAATVYKAQGSTYDSVFIDLENLGSCKQPDQVARMLYVGISRARNKVYLYGQLPSKYTGTALTKGEYHVAV